MKKYILTLCLVMVAVTTVCAKAYKADDLPVKTEYADSADFSAVCNPDRVLAEEDVRSINRTLWSLKSRMDVQGLVIVVRESDPVDGYDFSMAAARKFGVGGRNNLGFVVFLSTVARKYYILTGTGMEKYLTDAECSHIGRNIMVPLLKEEQWGMAVTRGVAAIAGVCNGEITKEELAGMDADADQLAEDEDIDGTDLMMGLLCIGGVVGGGIAYFRKKDREARKCPKCSKLGALNHAFRNVTYMGMGMATPSRRVLEGAELAEVQALMKKTKAAQAVASKADYRTMRYQQLYEQAAGAEPGGGKPVGARQARRVLVREIYECENCHTLVEECREGMSSEFRIGSFNGAGPLEWGAVAAVAVAAGSALDNRSNFGGHHFGGFGGFGSSGGSSHNTFGGGKFGGGGAGGSF